MGRSVETCQHAEETVYMHYDVEYDEDTFEEEWDCFQDGIFAVCMKVAPSLTRVDNKWLPYPYRESRILMENGNCWVTISEYSGCVALSFIPTAVYGDYVNIHESCQRQWICQVVPKIVALLKKNSYQLLSRLGTMSNGVGVFERQTEEAAA